MGAPLHAWVAGSCRPIDPGGVGSYGVVVRRGDDALLRDGGRVPDLPGRPMEEAVAEAFGLVVALDWLAGHATGEPATVDCVTKAVVMHARREAEATTPALLALQGKARDLLEQAPGVRLRHMGRTRCAEADALARLAYVQAMRDDPRLEVRFADRLATPYQLDEARKAGASVHAYLGADEADRLARAARGRR